MFSYPASFGRLLGLLTFLVRGKPKGFEKALWSLRISSHSSYFLLRDGHSPISDPRSTGTLEDARTAGSVHSVGRLQDRHVGLAGPAHSQDQASVIVNGNASLWETDSPALRIERIEIRRDGPVELREDSSACDALCGAATPHSLCCKSLH